MCCVCIANHEGKERNCTSHWRSTSLLTCYINIFIEKNIFLCTHKSVRTKLSCACVVRVFQLKKHKFDMVSHPTNISSLSTFIRTTTANAYFSHRFRCVGVCVCILFSDNQSNHFNFLLLFFPDFRWNLLICFAAIVRHIRSDCNHFIGSPKSIIEYNINHHSDRSTIKYICIWSKFTDSLIFSPTMKE